MQDSNTIKSGVDAVFVGIDWGASHHQLCAVNATGARQRQIRVTTSCMVSGTACS